MKRFAFGMIVGAVLLAGVSTQAKAAEFAPMNPDMQQRSNFLYNQPAPTRGYSYAADAKRVSAQAPQPLQAQPTPTNVGLLTENSIWVGAQFSRYTYQEPKFDENTDVRLRGLKYGISGDITWNFYEKWFTTLDARFAFGADDYEAGAAAKNGEKDNLAETRLIIGRDFTSELTPRVSLSPYIGVGYRYLANDARGTIETPDAIIKGYRRESQYVYLPVGITPRFLINPSSRVSLNFEYDQLIYGKQRSKMGDAGPVTLDTGVTGTVPSMDNDQFHGFGLRGQLMYETKVWALGPYFNYWNINQSKTTYANVAGSDGYTYIVSGNEPHNQTLEYGVQFKYRLY